MKTTFPSEHLCEIQFSFVVYNFEAKHQAPLAYLLERHAKDVLLEKNIHLKSQY
jgi:hypothetical protein